MKQKKELEEFIIGLIKVFASILVSGMAGLGYLFLRVHNGDEVITSVTTALFLSAAVLFVIQPKL